MAQHTDACQNNHLRYYLFQREYNWQANIECSESTLKTGKRRRTVKNPGSSSKRSSRARQLKGRSWDKTRPRKFFEGIVGDCQELGYCRRLHSQTKCAKWQGWHVDGQVCTTIARSRRFAYQAYRHNGWAGERFNENGEKNCKNLKREEPDWLRQANMSLHRLSKLRERDARV